MVQKSEGRQAHQHPHRRHHNLDQHLHRHLKLGARYYNPTTARFTQPDPSGKETNTYNYASCNPTNRSDPSGLGWFDDVRHVVGDLTACYGTGKVGAYVGGALGTLTGPQDTLPGARVGFVYGCGVGIFSAETIGYAVSM